MKVDTAAISLSGLCLVHCLALPIIASTAPIVGAIAEAEWLHQLFVAIAIPLAVFAFIRTEREDSRLVFGMIAFAGSLFLAAGAFVEQFHDYEVLLTTLGAVLLACAHLYRWRVHQA